MGSGSSSSNTESERPMPPSNPLVPEQNKKQVKADWSSLVEEDTDNDRPDRKRSPSPVKAQTRDQPHLPDPDIVLQPEQRQSTTMDTLDRRPPPAGSVTSEATTLSLGTRPPKPSIHEKIALQYNSPRQNPEQTKPKPRPEAPKRPERKLELVREETDIDEGEALQRLSAMLLKGSDKKQVDFHALLEESKTETFRCQERLLLFAGDAQHELYKQLEASLRNAILLLNQLNSGHDNDAENQRMAAIRHAQNVLDQLRRQAS